jgi:hypothetical protein
MDTEKRRVVAQALRAAAAKLTASRWPFDDRLAEVPDLQSAAEKIMRMLSPLDGIDDEPKLHARSLIDVLDTASIVETEKDLDANLKDAIKVCGDLSTSLKGTKSMLRDGEEDGSLGEDDIQAASEVIYEALAAIRSLISDIKNV